MANHALQEAIDHLSIADVYLIGSEARHSQGFNPKDANALENLKVQSMHIVRRSELLETVEAERFVLRIVLGFGVRWIHGATADTDQPVVAAFIEADYVAEYLMDGRLGQESIDAFALHNASYHVWPYWREYLMSQCDRLRMPRLVLPTRQFPDNRDQDGTAPEQ